MTVRHIARVGGLIALLSAGCGNQQKLGQVSGTVRVAGTPVTSGTIMFVPSEGKAAVGQIGPDGRYTLSTNSPSDGIPVGLHKVTIHATKVGSGTMVPASFEDELKGTKGKVLVPGKVEWIVPERFSQLATTDLTATVNPGVQTLDFDVAAK